MAGMDWVQVGAKVADVGRLSLSITTVEKITSKQVFLANGRRYSRDTGRVVGATAYDTNQLLPLDDPRVRDRRIRGLVRGLGSKANELCGAIKSGDEALAILNEVEKAVAAARSRIAALEGEG